MLRIAIGRQFTEGGRRGVLGVAKPDRAKRYLVRYSKMKTKDRVLKTIYIIRESDSHASYQSNDLLCKFVLRVVNDHLMFRSNLD